MFYVGLVIRSSDEGPGLVGPVRDLVGGLVFPRPLPTAELPDASQDAFQYDARGFEDDVQT